MGLTVLLQSNMQQLALGLIRTCSDSSLQRLVMKGSEETGGWSAKDIYIFFYNIAFTKEHSMIKMFLKLLPNNYKKHNTPL